MKLNIFILIVSLIIGLSSSVIADDSLWSEKVADLFADESRKFVVGDIVTVIIQEDANAIQSANTSASQDSKAEAESGVGIFEFFKAFSFNYSDEGSANGSVQRSGTLEADITTQVVDILPNGSLGIVGSKMIKMNGEEQIIKLSGIIRPEDISKENTIYSKKVADASIEYEGKGVVSDKQRPGLFERIFNWLF
jgi:flagellar L-ring protein FlgH